MKDKVILITFKSGTVQYIPLHRNTNALIYVLEYISTNFSCIEDYIIVEQATT